MAIVRRKKLINDSNMNQIKRIVLTCVINVIFILLFAIFFIAWTKFLPSIRQYCFANIGKDLDPAVRVLRCGLAYCIISAYVPVYVGIGLSICARHMKAKIVRHQNWKDKNGRNWKI